MTRTETRAVRERADVAEVARRLLGEPTGRGGRSSEGRRLWWRCPFHEDRNPSFCVEAGRPRYRCFGCGAGGDAIDLARKLRGLSFPQALAFVSGEDIPVEANRRTNPHPKNAPKANPRPMPISRPVASPDDGARQDRMRRLVEESERRLWSPGGRSALAYLRGRGLDDPTIRLARLGWAPSVPGTRFLGVVIPWPSADGFELVKLRQPRGHEPKYAEVYRRRPRTYPGPPLASLPDPGAVVLVEGELDALLLGRELDGLATVITVGSASSRPDEDVLRDLDVSLRLFVATDADEAGDRCASRWPARARRVRPPAPHKDWTEAHQAGIDLRRWWLPNFFLDPDAFEERAAIAEFDGGLDRRGAERLAAMGMGD